MKKEKLIEILTEMMATSPSRNWDLEARSTKQQIEDMRNQNENHILEFTDIILEEIKMKNKMSKRRELVYAGAFSHLGHNEKSHEGSNPFLLA